jgi:DnaJ-class molecular chaperone
VNISEVRALARMLDRVDYYRLLKVEEGCPTAEIRRAYQRARRRFDPDSFLQHDLEVREAIDRIARRLTEGYLVLRDSRSRAAYDRARAGGSVRLASDAAEEARTTPAASEGRTPNGQRFAALSRAEEREGRLKQAISHLRMALTFEPDNAAFQERLEQLRARAKAAGV